MTEREIIAKEWRDENGILHRREVGQELVRCKECRCGKHEFIDNMEWIYCKHHFDYWIPDDFCSYGEKQTEPNSSEKPNNLERSSE